MQLTTLLETAAETFGDRILVGSESDGLTARALRNAAMWGAEAVVESDATSIIHRSTDGVGLAIAMFSAAFAGVPLLPDGPGTPDSSAIDRSPLGGRALVIGERDDPSPPTAVARAISDAAWLAVTAGRSETGPQAASQEDIADPPILVVYTPGVVSAPKGVVLRHSHLTTYAINAAGDDTVHEGDAELIGVPLSEPAALTHLVRNIHVGRRSVFLDQLDPDSWLATARREQVTSALVSPPLLAGIVSGGDKIRSATDKAVPSLRSLEYGGAPMPVSVIQKARKTWPHLNFLNEYWLAETSSTIARLTEADYRRALGSSDTFVRARLGSVGRPVPGSEVQIRSEHDTVVRPGENGRIWVRGDQVSAEYADTGPRLDSSGFFDTGDDGFLDEDGYLYLRGRREHSIERDGISIAPEDIEAVLIQHPAVADVAVLGLPDEGAESRIVAVVVLRQNVNLTAPELLDFAAGRLRPAKVPNEIVFRSELPRTDTGKLIRRRLAVGLVAEAE